MLMRNKETGDLIMIESLEQLVSPFDEEVAGRVQSGQEEQDTKRISKLALTFPSGEALPRCWVDSQFRSEENRDAMPESGK